MKRRQRWLVIGEVERKYVLIRNCGFPEGLQIHWRGKVDWCQPYLFLKTDDLQAMVRVRLAKAGLQLIDIAEVGTPTKWLLKCLVGRLAGPVRMKIAS